MKEWKRSQYLTSKPGQTYRQQPPYMVYTLKSNLQMHIYCHWGLFRRIVTVAEAGQCVLLIKSSLFGLFNGQLKGCFVQHWDRIRLVPSIRQAQQQQRQELPPAWSCLIWCCCKTSWTPQPSWSQDDPHAWWREEMAETTTGKVMINVKQCFKSWGDCSITNRTHYTMKWKHGSNMFISETRYRIKKKCLTSFTHIHQCV